MDPLIFVEALRELSCEWLQFAHNFRGRARSVDSCLSVSESYTPERAAECSGKG